MTANEPLDEILRQVAGNPHPTEDDRRTGRRALSDAIRQEQTTGATATRRRLAPVLTAVSVLAVLLAVVLVAQLASPTAAEAALAEIAAAAEQTDPLTIPDQQYAYSQSETVTLAVARTDTTAIGEEGLIAYLLPATREMWVGAEGVVQFRTSTRIPRFFSAQDETDYYAAGLDQNDHIGETITETFDQVTSILDERMWPTIPDDLLETIRRSLSGADPRPDNIEILDRVLDLLREPDTPSTLRGAALRLIADLDVSLTQRTQDGGATFMISYDTPEPTSITVTIDGNGQLRHETHTLTVGDPALGIPPNTNTFEATYQPIQISTSLTTP